MRTVEDIAGRKVPVTLAPRRPGDPAALICDASKARAALGWQPRITALRDIVGTAWAWHQDCGASGKRSANRTANG